MKYSKCIKMGLMASLIVSLNCNFFPHNIDAAFCRSYPVPELSGNYCEDIISVAESQLGYTESGTGETVYSSWAGQPGRSWCSEFVAWCANRTGIPTSIIPVGTLKAKKVFGKKIKLKWTKLSNVKGYQIYRSTKKNSGYRLFKTVKKNTNVYKNANIKAGTRYYYKVRAYKVYKGKKIYGKYSNVESAKMK